MTEKHVKINVPVLARVEGEGALEIDIENKEITRVNLKIYEPPRFFEKFLEGRHYSEVPDIVARICGICPVAYQMTAVHAFENLFQTEPGKWIHDMRRLFYCGEWIESHALHIHLLAAPDFLGYDNVTAMAKDYPDEVRRGIQLQNAGNKILKFLGGRSVHPIGVKVGGFYHSPDLETAETLLTELNDITPLADELIQWLSSLALPNHSQDITYVALVNDSNYPFNFGNIKSNNGLNITASNYAEHFTEFHAPHSTALHSTLNDEPYLVGPLARLNLNNHLLNDNLQNDIKQSQLNLPDTNMFNSIIARAVEIKYALNEAVTLLEHYSEPEKPFVDVSPKAGIAYAATEAPRGLLWHEYHVDENGTVLSSRIVPPTSQNQARIEADLKISLTEFGLDQAEDKIRFYAEQIIRNYDPCISCATHFLDLRIKKL